ncbi:hypothetical protein C7N83_05835 [Neisseria iguanae]|uniref:Uncharacterized protein n=1 Tax=Neisseria iguanae TaxID=90242 RepID=A0A2P7U0K2_9NEIS|nr:hypothetical protein C7N83_05835 [Neisseria iguanae]
MRHLSGIKTVCCVGHVRKVSGLAAPAGFIGAMYKKTILFGYLLAYAFVCPKISAADKMRTRPKAMFE